VRRHDQFGPEFELYLIDNPSQEEIDIIKAANNALVNSCTENQASLKLYDSFNDDSKPLSRDHKWIGKWLDKKIYITDAAPIEQQIDLIVFSGIFYK